MTPDQVSLEGFGSVTRRDNAFYGRPIRERNTSMT